MSTDDLMSRALASLGEIDGPMSIEVIHRLADTSDVSEPMSIAEVAELLDVSAHTLRYYERAGLVEVDRDSSGHRSYQPEAVRRLVFLARHGSGGAWGQGARPRFSREGVRRTRLRHVRS